MSVIHRIQCGNVNCYIIAHGTSGILVDTGKKEYADKVLASCRACHVKLIVLTHAHFDHAENAARLSAELGIPIGMNENDYNLIASNTKQTLSAETILGKVVLSASRREFSRRRMQDFQPEVLLRDGDSLSDYGIEARIVGLPGHTDGSLGVDVDGRYFLAGDALMNMVYPTVSMLYHNREDMLKSAGKISALGERTIYFGHGKPTENRQWVR